MKKKLLCGILLLGLCLGSVQAAGNTFSDVTETDWFAPYVQVCANSELMKGDNNGNFRPDGVISLAETATIAARILEANTGNTIPDSVSGQPWYQPYLNYLTPYGVTVDEPTRNATREDFILMLAAVVSAEQLTPLNTVTTIPDTQNPDVLAFYNAGILNGIGETGLFSGEKTLTRAEAAAMVARVVDPSLRLQFTLVSPKTDSASPATAGTAKLGNGVIMTVNGHAVTQSDLEDQINSIAYENDVYLYRSYGIRLDLENREEALRKQLLEMAKEQAVAYSIVKTKAEEQGCTISDLPAVLFPSPSQSDLDTCVKESDLLCAKHILVEDEQTASAVLDGLKAVPELYQFEALLQIFGTDPGMSQNPDGYLFTAGEMVSEFEEGTRNLEIGEYSQEPVKSSYGYHIIWRLDPTEHPDIVKTCQEQKTNKCLEEWINTAKIETDDTAISALDVAAIYNSFLLSLSGEQ